MRLLLALGVIGGAAWVAYAFVPAECVPVTSASEVFCLRLWTPALFAMTAGFFGLRRWAGSVDWPGAANGFLVVAAGAGLMALANFVDYWLLSDVPFDSPDGGFRSVLSLILLLGVLTVAAGATGTGILLILSRRRSIRSRILGSLIVSVVSFALFVGLLAMGALAIIACGYALFITRSQPETERPELETA
ncbi:MAG TPA: hypothetical protein VJ850_00150 [Candidatus Limnocylindrales bacterium]|nr:hypothetical protein [Candidatus Limnocylindrales bacterium]